MEIKETTLTANLNETQRLAFHNIVHHMEEGGFLLIKYLRSYADADVVGVTIYGSNPMTSAEYSGEFNVKLLIPLEEQMAGRMSYTYKTEDGKLLLPQDIKFENVCMIAPESVEPLTIEPSFNNNHPTPVRFLWNLIDKGYKIIADGYMSAPATDMYIGSDVFSINIDLHSRDGDIKTISMMKMENGKYVYEDFYAFNTSRSIDDGDRLMMGNEKVYVKDDLGRDLHAYKINLEMYANNMSSEGNFNKFNQQYTYAVAYKAYTLATYLNGLRYVFSNMGLMDFKFALPYKVADSFYLDDSKQHNTFSIQLKQYDANIFSKAGQCLSDNSDILLEYLKSKDEGVREQAFNNFINAYEDDFDGLLDYFVNGILDAYAIQKGTQQMRKEIAVEYYRNVYKEFSVYGYYLYDVRTMFMRYTYRISKEFNSTLVDSQLNGSSFRVG